MPTMLVVGSVQLAGDPVDPARSSRLGRAPAAVAAVRLWPDGLAGRWRRSRAERLRARADAARSVPGRHASRQLAVQDHAESLDRSAPRTAGTPGSRDGAGRPG